MGLDLNSVKFLLAARQRTVDFDRTLMLGRQDLFVFPATMAALLERHGLPVGKFKSPGAECAYGEPFFEALGATEVDALDYSHFEGAKRIHDLNQPIPLEWHAQYDAVLDGGTLEHVFNFPVALRNAMELVRPGGRLFINTCANNDCGHGFYQFSPELFFRALNAQNGFEIERMVLHIIGPYGRWYEVNDPEVIRERVALITFAPIDLMVQAKRISVVPIFAKPPLQSDFTVRWKKEDSPGAGASALSRNWLSEALPGLARLIRGVRTGLKFYRLQSLRNRRLFKPVPKG